MYLFAKLWPFLSKEALLISWRQTSGRKLSHQHLTFKKKKKVYSLVEWAFKYFSLKYDGREGVIFDKSIVSLLPSFSSNVLLVWCLHLCCSYPCKAKAEDEMLFRLQMFQFKILSLSKRKWICWKGVDYLGKFLGWRNFFFTGGKKKKHILVNIPFTPFTSWVSPAVHFCSALAGSGWIR